MITLLIALFALPSSAAEKPAHTASYGCSGPGTSASVLDAFDKNMQRLFTSAEIKSDTFSYSGFVTSDSVVRGEVVYVTWAGQGFRLVGKFTPSLPSRNFSATLHFNGRNETVELGCLF